MCDMLAPCRCMCHHVGVMSLGTPVTPLQIAPRLAGRGLAKAAALSMFAASGLILASPGSVKAAACNTGGAGTTTGYSIIELQAASFSCDIEDLTYSEFEFNSLTSSANKITTGSYTFGYDGSGGYTFGTSGLTYTAAGFDYKYKVAFKPPIRPGQSFVSYDTGFTATPKTGGTFTFKKELKAFNGATQLTGGTLNTNPAIVAAKVTAENSTITSGATTTSVVKSNGDYNFAQPQEFSAIVFKNVVSRPGGTGGKFTGFTDYLQLKTYEIPTTPGPLPILGAAAAFSFSRQLRRRIKLA